MQMIREVEVKMPSFELDIEVSVIIVESVLFGQVDGEKKIIISLI